MIERNAYIRFVSITVFFILAISILSVKGAQAKMYKWVDDHGKTHFTDSKSKIPSKFRNQTPSSSKKLLNKEKPKPNYKNKTSKTKTNAGHQKNDCTWDYIDKLENCAAYSCQTPHPLVKSFTIQKTIVGFSDSKCRTLETMPNGGLMTCNYSLEQQKGIAEYLRAIQSGKKINFKSTSGTKGKAKTVLKIEGKEVRDYANEALQNGDCVISGYGD